MRLTASVKKALAASLSSRVACSYIERLNREEGEFKEMTRYGVSEGSSAFVTRSDWLFTRLCNRRPDVEYTSTFPLMESDSKKLSRQRTAVQNLLADGGTIWCGIKHKGSGATAILCKHGDAWIVIYEDGSNKKGDMPMFLYTWPCTYTKPTVQPVKFEKGSLGGFKLNRGA